jgi:hypothetical protein
MQKLIIAAFTLVALPALVLADRGGRGDEMRDAWRGWRASSTATTTPVIINITCVNTALDKREDALIAGHDALNVSVKTALQTRLTNLKAAWAKTTPAERQIARKVAYDTFNVSVKTAHQTMKTVRINTWNTFNVDMAACGVVGHGERAQNFEHKNFGL